MRDYGRVAPSFWTGATGRKLRGKPALQVVAMYLFTSPNANMIGLYYLPLPIIGHETGLPMDVVTDALIALRQLGVAKYDVENEIVFVPAMAKFQIGETIAPTNKNLTKGVARELERFERHEFGQEFIARYGEAFRLGKPLRSPFEAPSKGPTGPSGDPSKGSNESPAPLRDQEQEQETDQETAKGASDAPAGNSDSPPVQTIGHADPLTMSGLIAVVTGAVTRNHDEIGVYNQGRWAYDRAERFLAAIPPEKRTDALRLEIRARAEAFAKSREPWLTGGTWTVEKFCENYAALAKNSTAPPRADSSAIAASKRLAADVIARYGP